MNTKPLLALTLILSQHWQAYSQNYPAFGPEKKITISGLTFDAMEPFISPDGNTLFFNSLNSGGGTNLYYATRTNDTLFSYVGNLTGTYDTSANHLDAVASLDSLNNFFWVSTRGYPGKIENLHRGNYSGGSVGNITRVYGDFNIYSTPFPFGWLIMDAAINYQGNILYFCNAKFDFFTNTCGAAGPCEAKLGFAQKINDSTFNKISNSDAVFATINDQNYLVYAPHITKDGLELYYTRLLKNTTNTEICVAVRNTVASPFSPPAVIYSNSGFTPEAPSLTTDKQKMYYHQKDISLVHKICLRYRMGPTGIHEQSDSGLLNIFPNPTNGIVNVLPPIPNETFEIFLYNSMGQIILSSANTASINMSDFPNGLYNLILKQKDQFRTAKIIKE